MEYQIKALIGIVRQILKALLYHKEDTDYVFFSSHWVLEDDGLPGFYLNIRVQRCTSSRISFNVKYSAKNFLYTTLASRPTISTFSLSIDYLRGVLCFGCPPSPVFIISVALAVLPLVMSSCVNFTSSICPFLHSPRGRGVDQNDDKVWHRGGGV